jgi:hypothetical protein
MSRVARAAFVELTDEEIADLYAFLGEAFAGVTPSPLPGS